MKPFFAQLGRRCGMRRLAVPALVLALSLCGLRAAAQTDLMVNVDGAIPTGTYRNVEIRPGIVGTLSGPVTVTGTFQVDSAAAVIIADADYIDGNFFRLMPYGRVTVGSVVGIDGTVAGPIRTDAKDFGTKGRFTFNNATTPQIMGLGMADEVSELVINNAQGVTMSKPLAIRDRLWLRNGNLLTAGQQLTLLSRQPASYLASASAIVFNQNGVVVGNVTCERYISPFFNPGTGYRHFASSVQGSTVADLSTAQFTPVVNPRYNAVPYNQRFIAGNVVPYPNTFYYDESQVGTGGPGTYDEVFVQGYQSPGALSDQLQPMRGYTVRIPADQIVNFVGTLNDGPMSTGPLSRGPLNESGWHLIGNPYPSVIDWTLLMKPGMFNQFSKYRSTGLTEGVYDTYVNGIGTGPAGTEFIAPNQAFFVRVAQPGVPGQVQFEDLARITEVDLTSAAPFFRSAAPQNPRPLARLAVEGANDLRTEAVVYFEQGATAGIDPDRDGFYLSGGYPLAIYAQVGAEQVAINGLPALTTATDVTVPLVVKVRDAGTYRLNAAELTNFPGGFQVLLQDAKTGQTQNLTQNATYTFTASGNNADANRFSVRFRSANVTGTAAEAISTAAFDVFPNPIKGGDRLNVVLPGVGAGQEVAAVLFNDLGQRVWSNTFKAALGGVREEINARLDRGVYTLRVALPDGSKQSRRVVVAQ